MVAQEISPQAFQYFEVRLDVFDGPVDLLLHLVKQNELPIEKVSLAEVASQYLEYVEIMRRSDLELAGEYLVIAATLLSIKSSVLLNEPVQLIEDEEGNLIDPHEQLLARLREAEVFKESASYLGSMEFLGIDVFAAPGLLDKVPPPPTQYANHDPLLLGKAFRRLLEQAKEDPAMHITVEYVSVVECMMSVLDLLKKFGGKAHFSRLIPDSTTKMGLVGALIAMLELCKRSVIRVQQESDFGDIFITLGSQASGEEIFTSEFDEADVRESVNWQ